MVVVRENIVLGCALLRACPVPAYALPAVDSGLPAGVAWFQKAGPGVRAQVTTSDFKALDDVLPGGAVLARDARRTTKPPRHFQHIAG